MVAEKHEEQKSYQRALRVVGRYLDSEPSYNLSIAESVDGFTVRVHSTPGRTDERVKYFEWDRLEYEDQYYSAANRGFGERAVKVPWELFPCGHQQALRKLGLILDSMQVSSVNVDEVESGLDVSYLKAPAEGKSAPQKEQHTYGPTDLC